MSWESHDGALLSMNSDKVPIPMTELIGNYPVTLLVYLLNLVGSEIEGQEISVGFAISAKPDNIRSPRGSHIEAAISECVREQLDKIHLSEPHLHQLDTRRQGEQLETLARYRYVIRKMREIALGWTPADYEQPVLILQPANGKPNSPLKIAGVKLLLPRIQTKASCSYKGWPCGAKLFLANKQKSANLAYKCWTCGARPPATMAFWVKPAGTIRIYSRGKWIGQIMRLRDTGGWAVRDVSALTEFAVSVATRLWPGSNAESWMGRVVEGAMALSERRKGGAVYVMDKELWKIKDKKNRKNITSRTTHVIPAGSVGMSDMSESELACYLEQDGAAVIDPHGRLLALGNYFHGAGGRKKTAESLARKHRTLLAIVVSQDGPLYLYSKGLHKREREPQIGDETEMKPYRRLDFYLQKSNHATPSNRVGALPD